ALSGGRTALAGTVLAPAAATRYTAAPASGSLIFVSTAAEELFLGPSGGAIATTTDEKGRFELRVAPGKPLFVSAVLAGDRRLVGIATAPATGVATVDISLESTYVAEFLRRYSARAGKAPGDYDLAGLPALASATRAMLENGELPPSPDLSPGAVPDLVDGYLLAMAERRGDLHDAWARLLGRRPLAVTTLSGILPAGFAPSAIAVDPASGDVVVAGFNTTGVQLSRSGTPPVTLFRALAADGFQQVTALAPGPDGRLYFAQRVDRGQGGAIARTDSGAEIRLFRLDAAGGAPGRLPAVEELRLALPADLAPYLADTSAFTHVEPSALVWAGGKLYMADVAAALIYEFLPPAGLATGSAWPGAVHSGSLAAGRPARGNAAGPRRNGAAFGGITALLWLAGDLFFSDAPNGVIRAVNASGIVRDVAGRAGILGKAQDLAAPTDAIFDHPQGLAADAAGRLFVADGDNHRIRVLEGATVRTLAGGGTGAGDGDARTLALGRITSLAFDPRGNLLFNDLEAGSVRRLWLQHGI
ncbi:MAG: hypothetical protein FJZ01_26925, partial [Candidatus Sericytochromatia bacterium]|nr:hypothetical protein [Candidatus Tanganyikabacteria bacterium]